MCLLLALCSNFKCPIDGLCQVSLYSPEKKTSLTSRDAGEWDSISLVNVQADVKILPEAKEARGVLVKDSLLLEAVESLSTLLVQFQSTPIVGFVAQISSEAARVSLPPFSRSVRVEEAGESHVSRGCCTSEI